MEIMTSYTQGLYYSVHVINLQISVFVAVLGLKAERMSSYFCVHQLTRTKEDKQESLLLYLVRQYYAPFVLHKYMRALPH